MPQVESKKKRIVLIEDEETLSSRIDEFHSDATGYHGDDPPLDKSEAGSPNTTRNREPENVPF